MAIHTEIINCIIKKYNFTSYLEIGIRRTQQNFDHINCKFKIGVDPDPNARATFAGTSDEWFERYKPEHRRNDYELCKDGIKFDTIFIDGLHEHEQVKRDFENSLACLNEGGIILIHDTDPKEESFSLYPRTTQRRWNGTVYRFLWELARMQDIEYISVIDDPNGLTIVRRKPGNIQLGLRGERSYRTFFSEREYLLRPTTRQQFEQWI